MCTCGSCEHLAVPCLGLRFSPNAARFDRKRIVQNDEHGIPSVSYATLHPSAISPLSNARRYARNAKIRGPSSALSRLR